MTTASLQLVWADKPNPTTGAVTIAVNAGTDPTWYYTGARGQGWMLVAITLDRFEATEWHRFRVTPELASVETAVRLDSVVAS
ncbi:hypothetical protein [Micromonospora profundi]|uniref:hypothetical protein n=1 Tax=Micromonospora profundi TaxID=1420889 RepID=UPI00365469AD